jgi:LysM repeat protein
MGQLEKYGLYVLCLVIFLILGVTIWGNPERVAGSERSPSVAMRAGEVGGERAGATPAAGRSVPTVGDDGLAHELKSLIGPVVKGGVGANQDPSRIEPPKPVPADQPGNGPDAGGKTSEPPVTDTRRGSYVVQSGDSFDSIARTKLGSAALRVELQRLNPKVVPSKMQVGQELVLPSPAELARLNAPVAVAKDGTAKDSSAKDRAAKEAAIKVEGERKPAVEAAAERAYTIGKGDTFERIARAELGSSKRVEELRELNPSIDPTRLRIGQRIKLPKK